MLRKLFEEEVEIMNLGDNRFLIKFSEPDKLEFSVPKIGEFLMEAHKTKLHDIVACESELLIYARNGDINGFLKSMNRKELELTKNRKKTFNLKVEFTDGLDWEMAEEEIGLKRNTIIKRICNANFSFQMFGFFPGFMYLNGLEKKLYLPRRHKPRLNVEAGSLGLGGKYIGIYGNNAPAGWNIIGKVTPKSLRSIVRKIKIGDEVKFIHND